MSKKLKFIFLVSALIIYQLITSLSAKAEFQSEHQKKLEKAVQSTEFIDSLILSGRIYEAIPIAKEVLRVRQDILEVNHKLIAESLYNLANVYYLSRNYSKAKPLALQALQIINKINVETDNNQDYLIKIHRLLADIYINIEDYDKAKPLIEATISFAKQKYGEVSRQTIFSLNQMGYFYVKQNKYKQAEITYHNILNILQKQYEEYHPVNASGIHNLAVAYSYQGKYAEAESLFKKSLFIHENNFKFGGNKILPGIYEDISIFCLIKQYEDCAFNLINKKINQEESILQKTSGLIFNSQILNYLDESYPSIELSLSLYFKKFADNQSTKSIAVNTILNPKSRKLDLLTSQYSFVDQSKWHFMNDSFKEVLSKLIAVRLDISNIFIEKELKESDIVDNNHESKLLFLLEEQKRFESLIFNESYDNIASYSYKSILSNNLQQQIPRNAFLVEFIKYRSFDEKGSYLKPFGKERYAAYVLNSQDEAQIVDLGEAETIEQTVEDFRKYLRNQYSSNKQLKLSAQKLDNLVMRPIRKLIVNTPNVLISPDGVLNLIPFEALVDENNQYLVENYNFTYLNSGRDLLRISAKDKPTFKQPGIIMADPLYNKEGEKVTLQNLAAQRSSNLSRSFFERLEQTAVEAKAISSLYTDALVLERLNATENALKQVNQPQFLHLATHGFFIDKKENETSFITDNPLLRSGLVFAGVKKGQSAGDDGVLTALEATTLDLRGTQLVVLSACDTGVGEVSTGEGIYGLRRAFALAGSESQVISLWKVDDAATKELMVNYYRRLKKKEGRSLALHEVQREMLKSEDYQHPYYWASFIPSGDWSGMGQE